MKMINELRITLSAQEKNNLREAAEVVKEIVDALANNKANGWTPFQEGLSITEAFWDLKKFFERIEEEELIP